MLRAIKSVNGWEKRIEPRRPGVHKYCPLSGAKVRSIFDRLYPLRGLIYSKPNIYICIVLKASVIVL